MEPNFHKHAPRIIRYLDCWRCLKSHKIIGIVESEDYFKKYYGERLYRIYSCPSCCQALDDIITNIGHLYTGYPEVSIDGGRNCFLIEYKYPS